MKVGWLLRCAYRHPLRHSALGDGRLDIELVLWRHVIVA
ncbi:hypothetical protein APHMUC_1606 [Anaplasma phagocytophilum str. ApMUC09]|uniref:Uncharacterized protein n=1 Tax=Anaplasma phagocytophilum str. ApMUC09 TaxID=1359152 RepID=A0A0F3NAN5_ANAPH|nr:hypothetical protein APHMUC_1606 [Anaplasma phagocytophilum str. ApMUC09]